MREEQRNKRRHARVTVGGKINGRVLAMYEALLLNISLGGALIQHVDTIRPGTIISLGLELNGREVSANCRVVRSAVHRIALQPDGERALIYHTGVEFLDPSEETRRVVCDYVQSVLGDESGSSAGERGLREHLFKELEELDCLMKAAWRRLNEGTTRTDREEEGAMEQRDVEKMEVLLVGLTDMLGRLSEQARAVTEKVMGNGQGLSVEAIKKRIQVVQKEVYHETLHKYNDFLGVTTDAERDLVAKMERFRDLKERAGVIKELINSLTKPGTEEVTTALGPPQDF